MGTSSPLRRAWSAIGTAQPLLLLACVLGYSVTFWCYRAFPPHTWIAIVLAVPAIVVWGLPRSWRCDRWALVLVAAMAAILAWHALLLAWATPLVDVGLGRCAVLASALVIALSVAAGRREPGELFPLVGVGALATLAYCLVGMRVYDFAGWGLGNTNHLLSACSPAWLGWTAWAIARRWRGERVGVAEWGGLALFAVLMAWAVFFSIPGNPRRGVLLAAAAVAAVALLAGPAARHPRIAIAAAVVAVAAIGWAALAALGQPIADPRQERLLIYVACIQGALRALPWGLGPYGAVRLQDLDGEHVRHFAATNTWTLHAHNEVIDVAVVGGVVAVALLAALGIALAARVRAILDGPQRAGAMAIAVAASVHALTDNTYIMAAPLAWAGVLIGLVLRCPAAGAPVVVPVRVPALVLAALCTVAVLREVPAVILPFEATPEQRLAAVRSSLHPEFALDQWSRGADGLFAAGEYERCGEHLDLARVKVGWASGILASQVTLSQAMAMDARERLAAAFGELLEAPSAARLGAISALAAEACGHDEEQREALIVLLHRNAFNQLGYGYLERLLARRPDLAPRFQSRDIVRLRYRRGDVGLPEPRFQAPRDIEEGADLFAALMWSHLRERPAATLLPHLETLVRHYGDVPDVSLLVLEMARDEPPGTYEALLAHAPVLTRATQKVFPVERLRFLESVRRPAQAAAVWPFLSRLHAASATSLEAGRLDPAYEQGREISLHLTRVRGLALLHARQARAVGPAP